MYGRNGGARHRLCSCTFSRGSCAKKSRSVLERTQSPFIFRTKYKCKRHFILYLIKNAKEKLANKIQAHVHSLVQNFLVQIRNKKYCKIVPEIPRKKKKNSHARIEFVVQFDVMCRRHNDTTLLIFLQTPTS